MSDKGKTRKTKATDAAEKDAERMTGAPRKRVLRGRISRGVMVAGLAAVLSGSAHAGRLARHSGSTNHGGCSRVHRAQCSAMKARPRYRSGKAVSL